MFSVGCWMRTWLVCVLSDGLIQWKSFFFLFFYVSAATNLYVYELGCTWLLSRWSEQPQRAERSHSPWNLCSYSGSCSNGWANQANNSPAAEAQDWDSPSWWLPWFYPWAGQGNLSHVWTQASNVLSFCVNLLGSSTTPTWRPLLRQLWGRWWILLYIGSCCVFVKALTDPSVPNVTVSRQKVHWL